MKVYINQDAIIDALQIQCSLNVVVMKDNSDVKGTFVLAYGTDPHISVYRVSWMNTGSYYVGLWYETLSVDKTTTPLIYSTNGYLNDDMVEDYAIIICRKQKEGGEQMAEYAAFSTNWHVRHRSGKYSLPKL